MTKCEKCQEPISFKQLDGKWYPTNLDGSDHFDVCRDRRNAQMRKDGRPFKDGKGEGYLWKGKRSYIILKAGPFVGADYREIKHTCGLLPWESCNCGGIK